MGDAIRVRPGDRVAADGEVVEGVSDLDQSPVTGESVPAARGLGDPVFAGSIDGAGGLLVRATRAAADTTVARTVALVEEAEAARAPTERLIDRLARLYMPAVVGAAPLVAVLPPLLGGRERAIWAHRALALLLIGCPCAPVISVPAAIAAGLSAGAR